MNNIRNAILLAADSIEKNPHLYAFKHIRVADPDCGTPACAKGWIAAYSGLDFYEMCGTEGVGRYWCTNQKALNEYIGIKNDDEFYKRLKAQAKRVLGEKC